MGVPQRSAGRTGLEHTTSAENRAIQATSAPAAEALALPSPQLDDAPRGAAHAKAQPSQDDNVARLTRAIGLAADAGQWAVVTMLGGQLEALTRAAAGNVVDLSAARRRGQR